MKILKLIFGGDEEGPKGATSQSVLPPTFWIGTAPHDSITSSNQVPEQAGPGAAGALQEFLRNAPDTLQEVRKLFSDISRSPSLPARQQILTDICLQLGRLKKQFAVFQLHPAWQLAFPLEGLFQQLIDNPSQLTLSTLRTAASALVLLDSLCVPGLRRDLAHNPTVHILAVDDNFTCRQAILTSLKKTFAPPDVAEDGEAALALAEQQPYDIVFLDVEMPGTDGYEACARIRQMEANRNTPVVFVTSHSDFESRSRSVSSGGKDLIAKPFLSFEITVKALTLVLRKRLDENKSVQPEDIASSALVAA